MGRWQKSAEPSCVCFPLHLEYESSSGAWFETIMLAFIIINFMHFVCVLHYTVLALNLLVFLLQSLSRSHRVSNLLLGLQ